MLVSSGTAFFAAVVCGSITTASVTYRGLREEAVKSPFFLLAGDSTTAVQAENGGGWGDGFLKTTLMNGASGTNYGHNGATTASFRSGGDWAKVLAAAKASKKTHDPYITIQFGHNDQKPEKNITMAQLTANLVKYVEEARAVPATPILVTSLSRRRFSSSTGKVNENLADVTAAAKEAARRSGATLIDLNAASTRYLNAIGAEKAATYNLQPDDFTHLNKEGSVVFGNLVAMLVDKAVPELDDYVKPVQEIAKALEGGKYYFPAGR
ncbi:SGNH hydrolase-type esterase domain-containing protein [Phaeosphaeria sp. MPI-PUGE-AT-0046c]|nr:SGNH hydrolase-type esterase domain-containing protein [Phaeosphaeria sp. MPI-PUGE-AT-0046c]